MNPRQQLLDSVKNGLANNVISTADLENLLATKKELHVPQIASAPKELEEAHHKKLSIVDVLFYIAGFILFAAIMVMAFQAGGDSASMRIIITLGSGLLIWTVTYILGKQQEQTDVMKGLTNSLMLTGSLAVIAGAFVTTYQVIGGSNSGVQGSIVAYSAAITLVILGLAHLAFDRLMRHIILIVFAVVLLCSAFPTTLVAVLSNVTTPADVWALIGIGTGLSLGYGGYLASRTTVERAYLKDSFESLAALVILGSIYVASLVSDYAVIWEVALPLTIYLAFFISIKRKSKNYLFTGSFFLVTFLITMAFKYFSGLGVAFSLIISALSILATAFVATNINKKYIKQPALSK